METWRHGAASVAATGDTERVLGRVGFIWVEVTVSVGGKAGRAPMFA